MGLAIKGMTKMITDTLRCSDTKIVVSILTKLSGDQATLSKLKEDIENKKNFRVKRMEPAVLASGDGLVLAMGSTP